MRLALTAATPLMASTYVDVDRQVERGWCPQTSHSQEPDTGWAARNGSPHGVRPHASVHSGSRWARNSERPAARSLGGDRGGRRAVVFVGGALMAQVVALLVPWGCLLLVLGGIAVVHGVLVELRVEEPIFGRKRGDEDGN